MSWIRGYVTSSTRSNNRRFTPEAREERRAELEEKRLLQARKRKERSEALRPSVSLPASPTKPGAFEPELEVCEEESETRSLPDIFRIAEDIFEELTMTNYDEQNEEDDAGAIQNARDVKLPFNKKARKPAENLRGARNRKDTQRIFARWQ